MISLKWILIGFLINNFNIFLYQIFIDRISIKDIYKNNFILLFGYLIVFINFILLDSRIDVVEMEFLSFSSFWKITPDYSLIYFFILFSSFLLQIYMWKKNNIVGKIYYISLLFLMTISLSFLSISPLLSILIFYIFLIIKHKKKNFYYYMILYSLISIAVFCLVVDNILFLFLALTMLFFAPLLGIFGGFIVLAYILWQIKKNK